MTTAPIALKCATEYPLPANGQTHEIVSPAPGLLLVSQQPDSALLKIAVEPGSGRLLEVAKHTIQTPFAGLHGLHVSKSHPGCVWATLQFDSELLLIDPVAGDLAAAPEIRMRIQLPAPARGPHVVIEDGDTLWATCKDSHHLVRVSIADPKDITIYPCGRRPVFVAVHPQSRAVYASLDQSSAIFCIGSGSDPVTIPVPAEHGATPVGLLPGPDGNLWFGLLGSSSGGTGTFARINADSSLTWFQLKAGAAMGAAFIHLGFPSDGSERIYLLGSSMADMMALNAVFAVGMSGGFEKIETQQTIAFPSQSSMSHRVLATPHGLYVTELGACAVVHLQEARSPYGEGIDEASDPYSLWGGGIPSSHYRWP
jgi:virginiamycin B lyase